jgi:serine/threonine protein kinase
MGDPSPATNPAPRQPSSGNGLAEQIGGRRILRRLGRGGMGPVYLCQAPQDTQPRAVKVLAAAADESLIQRLRREAATLGEAAHPHVVRLEQVDTEAGSALLVMPYLGDERGPLNLERLLRERGGSLPPAEVGRYIRQLLQGLMHAHKLGLLHSDLKPSNLLFDRASKSATLKIADLGLVRVVSEERFRQRVYASVSQAVSFAGAALEEDQAEQAAGPSLRDDDAVTEPEDEPLLETWAYMAPEQKTPGGRVDERTDIHAVGLLAHRLLTGSLPEHFADSRRRPPARLGAWGPWIERCLAADPDQRFQTAREAYDALPEQTKANTGGRTATLLTIAAATALLVLAAIIAVPLLSSFWFGEPSPPTTAPQPDEPAETLSGAAEAGAGAAESEGAASPPVDAQGPDPVDEAGG